MSNLAIAICLFIVGAALGSFACCQAWRLRFKEKKQRLGNRSVCLHCKYQLRWYDNIPIFSWLILKGRCRKCKKPIGKAELISEFALGIIFALLGLQFYTKGIFNFVTISQIIILLITITSFWVMLIYDAKWQRLPVSLLYFTILTAAIYSGIGLSQTTDWGAAALNLIGAVGLLAGVYFLIYFFSKESMVGGGDWLLCLSIALLLGHWWLAIIELFLANLLAALATLPAFIKKGQKQLAFGPFLILAFVIVYLMKAGLMILI